MILHQFLDIVVSYDFFLKNVSLRKNKKKNFDKPFKKKMFLGHENGFKNGLVMLTWALSAVATGTGFYLVHTENDLSTKDKTYCMGSLGCCYGYLVVGLQHPSR